MSVRFIIFYFFLSVCIQSCRADQDVNGGYSVSSSDENAKTKEQNEDPSPAPSPPVSNSQEYFGWGANVGTIAVKKKLAECNAAGHFFDRIANNGDGVCNPTRSIAFKCNSIEEMKQNLGLPLSQEEQIDQHLNGDLKDYLVDQCVDDGTKYTIFFVKLESSGKILVTPMSISKNV